MAEPPRDVRALTAGVAAGDAPALARFYEAWFDFMFAEAWRVSRQDEAFCLDVVQDSMLRVIRALRPMESEARLLAWLRTVVRSCALDRLRGEARRRRREGGREAERPGPHAAETEGAADEESLAWLRGELAGLDRVQARMLVLRFKLGWTLKRIGAMFNLTPGAVDGRINRLLLELQRRGAEHFHDK